MTSYFVGKAVIVTGSSNGIGREVARQFASKGAKVTITGRNPETLAETRALCVKSGAKEGDILEVLGDLQDESTAKRIVDETVAKFGGIDVLVNNGAMLYGDPQHREGIYQPIELFDKNFGLNARSVVLITQLAAPHLEKTAGSVVNVSAIASQKFVFPAMPYYGAAKAALDHLTVSMAGTFIKKGVRVNGVSPGIIETDFTAKAGFTPDLKTSMYDKMANDTLAIPMGRVGRPSDIASVILFLADNTASAFILGQTIIADGGTSLNLAIRNIVP